MRGSQPRGRSSITAHPDGEQEVGVSSYVRSDDQHSQVIAPRLRVEGKAVELFDWDGRQAVTVFPDSFRLRFRSGRDHDCSSLGPTTARARPIRCTSSSRLAPTLSLIWVKPS